MSNINYKKAIDILTAQGKFYINLGLERVQGILNILGNPQNKLKFIHVAGTNGKGSVCAMLSSIFWNNNLKVGLFTSPHVFEYTERIKINDVEIEKEVFAQKIIKIVDLAEKNEIHLTEFEILTVVAFKYFAENKVDIVILETGLGGRLDATNVIKENICSIITHIDLDHTERLGDTIEKIAFEKAGIIKENCPVVVSSKNAGFETVKKIADEKQAKIIVPIPLCHCEEGHSPNEAIQENSDFGFSSPYKVHLVPYNSAECRFTPRNDEMSLKGTYQQENLALVLSAIELLNKNGFDISDEAIKNGLKNVKHPCRFEYIKEHNILIDGAHNPNGTKVLRESLNVHFPNQKFKFIFGCLRNKDYPQMMKNLFTSKDEIYFYHFDNENSCSEGELANASEFVSKSFSEYEKDNTLTVICGSFYMIKELLSKMGIK